MPTPGQATPVDDDWRDEVDRRLKERKWGQADLCRADRALKGKNTAVSRLLSGRVKQSPLVPIIERILGMPARIRKPPSDRTSELIALIERLPELHQAEEIGRIKAILETLDRPPG